MKEESYKIPGSIDTFTPQELRATPRSSEQGSQAVQEKDFTGEAEDLDLEEGSRSSKEMDLTEECRDQELEEPGRCINQQVKEKEDDDMMDTEESS